MEDLDPTIDTTIDILRGSFNKKNVDGIVDFLSQDIDKISNYPKFWKLPIKAILMVIAKSEPSDKNSAKKIATKLSERLKQEQTSISSFTKSIPELKNNLIYKELISSINKDYNDVDNMIEELSRKKKASMEKPRNFDADIHNAAQRNNLKSLKYLIEVMNVDIGSKDKRGWTPLYIASKQGYLPIVKYLVEERGADPSEMDKNGWNSLHIAAKQGKLNIVKYLIEERHLDPSERSDNESTPLHLAALKGHLDVVKYLVEKCGLDPNDKDKTGWLPLHVAAKEGRLDVVKYFIEICKCKVDTYDLCKRTPLALAIKHGRNEVSAYLIQECKAKMP